MSNNGVRIQNLRDFTVQIRHTTDPDRTVGTGIVVSADGKILTCAHVVLAAGVNPRLGRRVPSTWELVVESIWGSKAGNPLDNAQAQVGVYFPQVRGERKEFRARVVACCPEHDNDVVLLQLVNGPAPLGLEQIAVLSAAEPSEGNPFRSYGYSPLGHYPAARAEGSIMGLVEPPLELDLQAEPVMLRSRQIAKGMSGAGVLDVERNLVVGLIAERWVPPDNSPIQDDIGWGVDCQILTFDPYNTFGLPLRDAPLEKRPVRPPSEAEQAAARQAPQFTFPLEPKFHNAPPSLGGDWAGRADLLRAITADWVDSTCRVTGLIGFGGEGKSSLARRWLGDVLNQRLEGGPCPEPDGVFWWSFYENRSVDAFFEAALTYLGGGDLAREYPSATVRAGVIAALLKERRFIFVLDGLEVMQHQDGDSYGLLFSNDLRDFFSYLAGTEHESFCLVTSRAPLLDLLDYPAYTHHDVERLDDADARALLTNLGVTGSDAALDHLSHTWDNHALTLSLLGSDIVERYGGDLAQATDLPLPTAGEPRYERVARVLRRYDEHLTEAERAFLTIFSAFRLPVHESAFETVFRPSPPPGEAAPPSLSEGEGVPLSLEGRGGDAPALGQGQDGVPLSLEGRSGDAPALGQGQGRVPLSLEGRGVRGEGNLTAMLTRLTSYRLLRYNPHEQHYTTHPLIRNHYEAQLAQANPAAQQEIHRRLKDHYLARAGDDTPRFPTLDDLALLIEAVHHACRAGAYDEANDIRRNRIYQDTRKVIIHQLGAYETNLAIMLEFFPHGDTTQEPQVSQPDAKRFILSATALCLMSLGRLADAVPFYERAVASVRAAEDWHNASRGYTNLADLHTSLGRLAASAEAAREALALARRAEDDFSKCQSMAHQAWAVHLQGDLDTAEEIFKQAEVLEQKRHSITIHYLYSNRGIFHAEHLRRTGNPAYARQVTVANLEICERNRWPDKVSLSHRVLGDLDADENQPSTARRRYDEALRIARGISLQHVLIEALLARGRWSARQGQVRPARNNLDEALGYAVDGGYRIYEADIRIALAWAHRAVGQLDAARAEASRALQMSQEMGYYWGQVDAEEVLNVISTPSTSGNLAGISQPAASK